MKSSPNGPVLSFTCVYIQDTDTLGYSAFFEEFPDTFAQGKTKDEALLNLWKVLAAVFASSSKEYSTPIRQNISKQEVILTYAQ